PEIVDVQFASPGSPAMTGRAVVGFSCSDQWNLVSETFDGDPSGPYADVTDANNLRDVTGATTSINVHLLASDNAGDLPLTGYSGTDPTPLLNSILTDSSGDSFTVAVDLPSGTYDIYVYASWPYGSGTNLGCTNEFSYSIPVSGYPDWTETGTYDRD